MKQQILLLKGLPASGKSTFAKELCEKDSSWKRINKDDIRDKYPDTPWSKEFENIVLEEEREYGKKYLILGFNLIVDDTNFTKKHEDYWKQISKDFGCNFEIKLFNTSLKTCIERDSIREKPVGESVIKRMFYQNKKLLSSQIKYDNRQYLEQNIKLPRAIICDLDGTLALINGRSPYDHNSVTKDLVNLPIKQILQNYYSLGYQIIYLSGRMQHKEKEEDLTIKWLQNNNLIFGNLLLFRRANGDFRKDSVIKRELFDNYILNKYYVDFILDDRSQVVDMWRDLGLLCLQVYWGDF